MEKMAFSEYMNSLSNTRLETVDAIASLTCSSKATVYRWMNGTVTPPPIKRKIISEYLNMPETDLFPAEK